MPRISEAEIDRIKRETDLAALVRSRGVELRRHGAKDLVGRCPFHEDEDPSFVVSPEKGLFHCLGCGAAGNAIQFVQKFDGVSFRHAFEILNAGPAAFSAPAAAPLKEATVPRLDSPLDAAADEAILLGQVADYYHQRLSKTPAAVEYLRGRGVWSEEAAERFRLGFADRTLGLRLPDKNRKEGAAIRARLQRLGLFRESGHEHFTGSVVLPIGAADDPNRVAGMYGRKIADHLKAGTPKHLYLPGPHAGIWNAEALNEPDLILCEAAFDALSFWVHGFRAVTFIYGTNGFTDELFEAILARKVKRVRLAYDADEAGNRAAQRDVERLSAHGIECYRVRFPWGMDANEYARKVTPSARSLDAALRAAEPAGDEKPHAHTLATPERSRAGGRAPVLSSSLAAKKEAAVLVAPPVMPSASAQAAPDIPAVDPSALACQAEAERRLERAGEYLFLRLGSREYRVGGLEKNNSLEAMKVALRLRAGECFHLDAFDLLRDGERRRFIERAAEETRLERELVKSDLGRLLWLLEQEQTARLEAALKPEARNRKPDMSAEDRAAALNLLKSPDLIRQIGEAFDACGLVGEEANRLAAYLACTSRKLERPLAVIVQSTSAAGKSALMEAVLAMFPEEERVKYSAMTGQSLYYLGEADLQHKILAIVEEEGAEKASYALKLLQSEGELTIASTGKDPHTGRMETQEYHVAGPVMIFLTTTAIDIDEELQNRCLTLTVDESRAQTERIHALQRQARTLEGLRLKKRRQRTLALLRDAQRLLEPVDVVNPWADRLTFTAERTRTRRDHEKYLTLIDAVALLHQHQRERCLLPVDGSPSGKGSHAPSTDNRQQRTEYIRVTLKDIALANRLAPDLLGRSLDELPPQTRRVLEAVKAIVRERCEAEGIEQRLCFFSRREIRARLGWSVTQVRVHLDRLRELEHIAARYGRPGSAFQYELVTDCREQESAGQIGLLAVEKLQLRRKPDGVLENLTGGWRTPARQVQPVEEPPLVAHMTA